MSSFSDFRKEYATDNGHSMDTLPTLKAEDRAIFIKAGIPFTIPEASIVKGQFGTQICYHLEVDQNSAEWKNAGRMLSLSKDYNFWVKATDGRTNQYRQIIEPDYQGTSKLLVLIKPEKDQGIWDFDDYTPGRPAKDLGDTRVGFDPFLDYDEGNE